MSATFSEPIRQEARRSGLGASGRLSLREVERRRLELWGIVLALLTAVSVALVLLSAWPRPAGSTSLLSAPVLRIAMVLLAVGFGAYVMEKEIHLRKLSGLLVDEQVTIESLTRKIEDDTALMTAGKAIQAMLDVDRTLELILDSAIELLHAEGGSIHLLSRPGALRCVVARGRGAAQGGVTPLGERVEGRVALKREALLIPAPRQSSFIGTFDPGDRTGDTMCAPLTSGDELVGVIRVDGRLGSPYAHGELESFKVYAEHVAPQVANAQLYQRERARVGELLEVYRLKADFVSAMVNELRAPIRGMIDTVESLRTMDPHAAQRAGLLDAMERDGTRLLRLVDRLRRQGRHASRGAAAGEGRVDVGALATMLGASLARQGRPVDVRAESECVIMGDEEIVQPVLLNLIDNAFRHGRPPVRVLVDRTVDQVLISVEDSGPGVPDDRRERVFLPGSGEAGMPGAGLSIVRGVVTALRGTVWVEDAAGGGAAFRITLPAEDLKFDSDEEPAPAEQEDAVSFQPEEPFPSAEELGVEDNRHLLEVDGLPVAQPQPSVAALQAEPEPVPQPVVDVPDVPDEPEQGPAPTFTI
jgi:Histidine kinase-, DNA gyrase B-, and HSP90-like ATPase/GAF domain